MTLGELMQLALRLQAQAQQARAAIGAYDGWRDSASGDYCADMLESISFELDMVRDTLRAEMRALESEGMRHER